MRIRSLIATSVICLSVALAGCDRSDDKAKPADSSTAGAPREKAPPSKKGTIGVSGDFDVAKQQNQVRDFIVGHCAAIVLCPCDSRAIGPAIKEANVVRRVRLTFIHIYPAPMACAP